MSESFEMYCRICLDVESRHVSILDDPAIYLHLRSCLAMIITDSDVLPKSVCTPCAVQLEEFYKFQLNARCSQDWLESNIQEKPSKSTETKTTIQPLPGSEYNSDSLLEFLNNTSNIEDYLNNLGKEDMPCLVSMLEKNNENSLEGANRLPNSFKLKLPSPKKKELALAKSKKCTLDMDIDVLDSDIEIVKEILMKETEKPKTKLKTADKIPLTCFACKLKCENIHKLSQHVSTCDLAHRTCITCNLLLDSRQKMLHHRISHITSYPSACVCGLEYDSKEKLLHHYNTCYADYSSTLGCSFRCKQCGEVFKQRFLLYNHAKQHVLEAQKKVCDLCGHSFLGEKALSAHKKEDHDINNELSYRCKICSFTSKSHKEIYLHAQKHTSKPPAQRHLCECCGNSFTSITSLMRHAIKHGFKKHKCNICGRMFSDENTRDKHLAKHEEGDILVCEKCGQTLNSLKLETHCCEKKD